MTDADWPRIEAVSDLVLIAGRLRPCTVIIPGGDREDDLRLVESARDHGIVDRCILVGDERAIRAAADAVGIAVADEDIVGTTTPDETAVRTVEQVLQGNVDVILKGDISTPVLNRAMVKIAVRETMSLVTMFDAAPIAGGRPMLLTDPGVTTVCNFGRMVGLVENAVDVAHAIMGLARPRVAILSANEKYIESLPSTRMGQLLSEHEWDGALVYGPLSFDLAISEESVRLKDSALKGAGAEVAGRADILVCPGLDSANILYKVIMEMVKFGQGTFAGVTVGVAVPYVILSRADNVETKLQSIALSSIASERMEMGRRRVPKPVSMLVRALKVLAVKPEPTATRLALFENEKLVGQAHVTHEPLPSASPEDRASDVQRRAAAAADFLRAQGVDGLDGVVTSGGLLPQAGGHLAGGTYVVARLRRGEAEVDEALVKASADAGSLAPHSAHLGIPVAAELARRLKTPAFVVTPEATGEFALGAATSGLQAAPRRAAGDLLTVWAVATTAAEKIGLQARHTNYIVAHLGSEITVAAVRGGKIVDSELALGREAATGSPSYPGGDRLAEAVRRLDAGEEGALPLAEAMIDQIAKTVGAMAVAAGPDAEGIILTGDLSRLDRVVKSLRARLSHLLPVFVVRQSPELDIMAQAACRALSGREPARLFAPL